MEVNREHVLWGAGLVEGEGCFLLHCGQPNFTMDMCDKDVLEQFVSYFPMCNLYGPYTHKTRNDKPRYRAYAFGKNAYALAVMLFPFLGARRKDKIQELIKKW